MKNEITKMNVLTAIVEIMKEAEDTVTLEDGKVVTAADIVEYAEKTMAQLTHKNEKAKERQEENKANDYLRNEVARILTTENQTIDEIMAALSDTYKDGDKEVEITKAKVIARLIALVKAENAIKEEIKIVNEKGEKRKVMAYRKA